MRAETTRHPQEPFGIRDAATDEQVDARLLERAPERCKMGRRPRRSRPCPFPTEGPDKCPPIQHPARSGKDDTQVVQELQKTQAFDPEELAQRRLPRKTHLETPSIVAEDAAGTRKATPQRRRFPDISRFFESKGQGKDDIHLAPRTSETGEDLVEARQMLRTMKAKDSHWREGQSGGPGLQRREKGNGSSCSLRVGQREKNEAAAIKRLRKPRRAGTKQEQRQDLMHSKPPPRGNDVGSPAAPRIPESRPRPNTSQGRCGQVPTATLAIRRLQHLRQRDLPPARSRAPEAAPRSSPQSRSHGDSRTRREVLARRVRRDRRGPQQVLPGTRTARPEKPEHRRQDRGLRSFPRVPCARLASSTKGRSQEGQHGARDRDS